MRVQKAKDMKRKGKITAALRELGMAWAISDEKFEDAWHVHPDAASPRQESIVEFGNLDDLEAYITASRKARATEDVSESIDIMQQFWSQV